MDDLWYKNAVIYAVDVERFMDGDGDGCGDFKGLIERLGYLTELGVTALWLTPFYPTANRDNGYDVTNYYDVDPRLGTLEEFIDLVHRAGEHGIRVVIDLVMNHTSNRHPWFQASRHDRNSRYRDYYVWADHPPPVPPGKGSIFPGEEQTIWTFDPVAGAYYYHRFYDFQPELKLASPAVQAEVKRIVDFWLSLGISGMRIDAASHMVERKGVADAEPDNPHGILKDLHAFATGRHPGVALIGETDVEPQEIVSFFGDNDELTMIFNFLLNNHLMHAFAIGDATPVAHALHLMASAPEKGQWANFLRNFDEVDLERLSDADRQQVFEAFAPEESMQIFGRGIRRRLAPMLGGDMARLRLAFSLLFSLPGAPVFVYGDEIGMGEDLSLPGRQSVRLAMQWSAERNGGFSNANALCVPVQAKGDFGFRKVSVAKQRNDADSLLNWMKRLIQLRRDCPEIGFGDARTLTTGMNEIFSHCCEWKDGLFVAVHNLSAQARDVSLDIGDVQQRPLRDLWGHESPERSPDGRYRLRLEPYGYRWYRALNR